MKKLLVVDGIKIYIDVKATGEDFPKYQFTSKKYDIWCLEDSWEVAKENLIWILKDRAFAFVDIPFSQMMTPYQRKIWKTYKRLIDRGLKRL